MDRKYTILCVDDEQNVLKSLERLLICEEYEVLLALSGEEGLRILEEKQVDLLIVDQRMPQMSGTELLIKVKEKYPGMMRIMLSGYSEFSDLLKAVNEGEIYRFITKPWDNENIQEIVGMTLERKRILEKFERMARDRELLAKFPKDISIETIGQQHNCMVIRIVTKEESFDEEIIGDFIKVIFNFFSIDEETSFNISSGDISKKDEVLSINVDIGNGICVRIELAKRNEGVNQAETEDVEGS